MKRFPILPFQYNHSDIFIIYPSPIYIPNKHTKSNYSNHKRLKNKRKNKSK